MKKVNQVVLEEEDLLKLADILSDAEDACVANCFTAIQENLVDLIKFCKSILEEDTVLPDPEFNKNLWPEVNKQFNEACSKQLELFPELGTT